MVLGEDVFAAVVERDGDVTTRTMVALGERRVRLEHGAGDFRDR